MGPLGESGVEQLELSLGREQCQSPAGGRPVRLHLYRPMYLPRELGFFWQ
jgi:hypothetical protein